MNKEEQLMHEAVNTLPVLTAQKYIAASHDVINDQLQHDEVGYTAKLANDAIKHIEAQRKTLTNPLDDLKKRVMNIEKDAVLPLKEYVEKAKALMLDYAYRKEQEQKAANEKMQQEAAKAVLKGVTPDVLGDLIDTSVTLHIEQPKNIRTTIKARTDGSFVAWEEVIEVLILADKFDAEVLLKNLPDAMRKVGCERIKGIELYEHKVQVIR